MSAIESPEVLRPDLFAGRTCIVTGAGSGIGRGIALRLLALGADVIGVGRRSDVLEQTAELAGAAGARFSVRPCDVRDIDAIDALVHDVGAARGIDLLVNNAGGQFYAPLNDVSRNGWNAVIDLNLSAIFSITKVAYPYLKQARGSVVSISLSGVDRGMMGGAHALAARAGVLALTRSLALEWACDGIRLNCIGPGLVLTEGLAGAAKAKADEFLDGVPAGRPTHVDEIAELVAFMASEAGRMMTGQLIQIDGGIHIGSGIHPWSPPKG